MPREKIPLQSVQPLFITCSEYRDDEKLNRIKRAAL